MVFSLIVTWEKKAGITLRVLLNKTICSAHALWLFYSSWLHMCCDTSMARGCYLCDVYNCKLSYYSGVSRVSLHFNILLPWRCSGGLCFSFEEFLDYCYGCLHGNCPWHNRWVITPHWYTIEHSQHTNTPQLMWGNMF